MKKLKIKNIEKAAERIKKAVQNKERIILFGDSDLDGIASVVLLEEAIKNLGGKADCIFFPDRELDGYGINLKALDMLKSRVPALLITMDLGIGNYKEVDVANSLGFEVVIIDHHEPLDKIPKASIIVDPHQKDDPYPFKGLADVGVVYNLCLELLGDKISPNLNNSLLELAAMATIADMVPQVEQNQQIIQDGLRSLRNTFRPGLKAFLDILGDSRVFEEFLPKIISALNSAESLKFENESYRLLTSSDQKECRELAQKLINNINFKQIQIKNIAQEVERRIARKPDEAIIFEGDPSWKLVLAGPVASIICEKYGKPTFIFRRMDTESSGSVRNPEGTNSVDAMATSKDFLITYGGHACASGFRVKNEYLDKFKNRLTEYFRTGK